MGLPAWLTQESHCMVETLCFFIRAKVIPDPQTASSCCLPEPVPSSAWEVLSCRLSRVQRATVDAGPVLSGASWPASRWLPLLTLRSCQHFPQ